MRSTNDEADVVRNRTAENDLLLWGLCFYFL